MIPTAQLCSPRRIAAVLAVCLACATAALADEPPEEAQPERKARAVTPLQKLIQRVFGQARELMSDEPAGRDYIVDRAPVDKEQINLFRAARSLIEQGEHKQAVEALQRLLDRPTDSLYPREDGRMVPLRAEAGRLLGQLPPQVLAQYRAQYGPLARTLVEQAQRNNSPALYLEAATRFFHTDAGQEAANRLGGFHFDRGEFGMASRWFEQLRQVDSPLSRAPAWQVKAAFAAAHAGELEPAPAEAIVRQPVKLGGRAVDPLEWLAQAREITFSPKSALDDWLVQYGTPSRTGTARGSDPLLLPEWTVPTTHSHRIQTQIAGLAQDLADQSRAMIPAFSTITVNGKAVFRTLRGVRVVDVATGRPLWETEEGISAEQLLSGSAPMEERQEFGRRRMIRRIQQQGAAIVYSGNGAENHPLTGLLFRDGTHGLISSDGRQLFVIEGQAVFGQSQPGQRFGGLEPSQVDPYGRDWSSNSLRSYDLESGAPLWRVGGGETNEPFQVPLAGCYFHGPPVAEGGELFVVGEKAGEVLLYCLAADSGEPKWSQLIAYSDVKIEQDIARRHWPAQVAVQDGVLICPTTVGWLVALDRLRNSILWAQRFSDSKQTRTSEADAPGRAAPALPLNTEWCPSAPVISGNKVVYTPSEEPLLVCLNLSDGKRVWQKPKDDSLYLAGVFDERVVVMGTSHVAAYSLADGASLWTAEFAEAHGRPSGRGVAVGEFFYQPLSSGQLWKIDLRSGKMAERSYVAEGESPLGNLSMYRGKLLSLTAAGLTSFEQRDALLTEIRERQKERPEDSWSLLRLAEMSLMQRDYTAALEKLRRIAPGDLDARDQGLFRNAMLQSLTSVIQADSAVSARELDELKKLATTPDEKRLAERLDAERLIAAGEHERAFDALWKLAEETRHEMVPRADDPRVHVRFDLWLAGRMADVWQTMTPEARERVGSRIETAAEQAAGSGIADQLRFAEFFRFHPSADELRLQLVEQHVQTNRFAAAETLLLDLAASERSDVAAGALERLGRLMLEFDLPNAAATYYSRLAEFNGDVRFDDGRTAQELAAEGLAKHPPASFDDPADIPWAAQKLRAVQSGINYSSSQVQDLLVSSALPWFHEHRLDLQHQDQQLAVVRTADESCAWLVPLRSAARSSQGTYDSATAVGHQLYVLHRSVLHCLSPVDREVLWARSLEESPGRDVRPPVRASIHPLRTAPRADEPGWEMDRSQEGSLALANSAYVATVSRREVTVHDPLTGDVRWTRAVTSPHTLLIGDEDVLFVASTSKNDDAWAFRARDGKPLDVPELSRLFARAIDAVGRSLLLLERDDTRGKSIVRLHDPLAGRDRWRKEYPQETRFGKPAQGMLTAVLPDGTLELISTPDGAARGFADRPLKDVEPSAEVVAVADAKRLYVLANGPDRGRGYAESIPSLRANGLVSAFDLESGRKLWDHNVSGQNLVLERLDDSPLLVFVSRTWEQRGNFNFSKLQLLALNKTSGEVLLDVATPTQYGGFHSLQVNLPERYVELTSYNQRVRLAPVAKSTE